MTENEQELYDALDKLVDYSSLIVGYLYEGGYPGKSQALSLRIDNALKVMEKFNTVAKKPSFVIVPVEYSVFKYVVFSTDYERPEEYMSEVVQELKNRNVRYALLDLMCSNGVSEHNRFFEILVEPFRISLFDIDDSMMDFCNIWYRNNAELLSDSVLTEEQQFLFLRNELKSEEM
jgi:hypothetical protein